MSDNYFEDRNGRAIRSELPVLVDARFFGQLFPKGRRGEVWELRLRLGDTAEAYISFDGEEEGRWFFCRDLEVIDSGDRDRTCDCGSRSADDFGKLIHGRSCPMAADPGERDAGDGEGEFQKELDAMDVLTEHIDALAERVKAMGGDGAGKFTQGLIAKVHGLRLNDLEERVKALEGKPQPFVLPYGPFDYPLYPYQPQPSWPPTTWISTTTTGCPDCHQAPGHANGCRLGTTTSEDYRPAPPEPEG